MLDDARPYGRVIFQLIRFANYLQKGPIVLGSWIGVPIPIHAYYSRGVGEKIVGGVGEASISSLNQTSCSY